MSAPAVSTGIPRGESAHIARRVAARFAMAYAFLFCLPFPLSAIPGLGGAAAAFDTVVANTLVASARLRGVEAAPSHPGSGDGLVDWLEIALWLVVAAVATAVSFVRELDDERLRAATRVFVRYFLAFQMLLYGMPKLFDLQFGDTDSLGLDTTYGASSPMGLLWRFMAHSDGYSFFAGAGEVIGGALLLTRRTTLLGALIVMAVMSNVVALNFAYDVPVKILSSHLLALSVFLVVPDAPRLLDFFVRNRPVPAAPRAMSTSAGQHRRRRIAKAALILAMLATGGWVPVREWGRLVHEREKIDGVYRVEEQSLGAAPAWRKARMVEVESGVIRGSVEHHDGARRPFELRLDPETSLATLRWKGEDEPIAELMVTRDAARLTLVGTSAGAPGSIVLRRIEPSEFPLNQRGFHWVNERPFHR